MLFEDVRKQFFPMALPASVTGRVVDLQTLFAVRDETRIFDPAALGHYEPPTPRRERIKQLERVTVITHTNNRAMLIANLKAGFSLVGMENHESGGAMVKLAYHLHDDRRADFCKAFRLPPDEKSKTQQD